MLKWTLPFAAVGLAALLAGCSAPTYTFSVSIQNATPEPVTVWLTKRGGPEETDWLAPEALGTSPAAELDLINGIVIPNGKTGEIGPISGKFDPGSLAILRVYRGKLDFDQILATSADGILRVDMPLREGANRFVVRAPLRVDRE